jgi:hypothetical protein
MMKSDLAGYKKVLAREFLLFLFSCFVVLLVFGYFFIYNWMIQSKDVEISKQISELKANELLVNFNKKKEARKLFFSDWWYYYQRGISKEDGVFSDSMKQFLAVDRQETYYKFWKTMNSLAYDNNPPQDWAEFVKEWNSVRPAFWFVDFCYEKGYHKPDDLFQFIKGVHWTNLEVENIRNINDRISNLKSEGLKFRPFSKEQITSYTYRSLIIVFGLVFILRYLVLAIRWSIITLRTRN